MKSFKQWAEENQHELPTFTDAPAPKKTIEEKGQRTGLSANYPAAYSARQGYPDSYFMPRKATAALDLQILGGKKDK
jgi:hypothetical protein